MKDGRTCVTGVIAVAIAFGITPGQAQQQQPPASPPQRAGAVNESVRAILVDVVVRDKKGLPVRDLTQSDFEVVEDNVPQKVGSFTPVFDNVVQTAVSAGPPSAPAPAASGSGAAPATPTAINGAPPVTALVFDRLTPEARKLAVQAAQNYFGSKEEAPGYVGIFSIDNALTPFTPFTRNVRLLKDALAKLSSRGSSSFNSSENQQKAASLSQRASTAAQAASNEQAGAGRGGGGGGTSAGDAQLAALEGKMVRDFDVMERDQEGYATTNGLFAIVNALKPLPGRKSLVLFSEGLSIPPAVQRLFLGVIDSANRANVSIYTMDAAGLRAESEQAKIRDQVNAAGNRGILTGYASNSANDEPLSKALEKNEDVLRQDPRNGLGELARSTGGLAFDNTNNLRQGFDRVESDQKNYYLLGYTPINENFDGHFRAIEVKVKRPGVTVAARKGYFAVRDPGTGGPVNSYEAPALGALEQKPVPNAFPVHAAAMQFPERDRPQLVPVIVDLKTAPLTFAPTEDGKSYTSDFAVIVRFLDQQDQVVRKVSQHYEVKGPVSELERAKQGEVLFYREPQLSPGLYTMETIVYDAPSGKASVRFSTLELPKAETDKLRMSSLILVKRGEKVPEKDRRAENPLLVKDLLLYPNLGDPVSKASKEAGFFFTVYPAPNGPAPQAVLELMLNGTIVAQLPMPLSPADASGRIQQLGRLPLDQLSPDTYEMRAVVKQGDAQVFKSVMLRVVN